MKKIILMMVALTYALLANEIGKPFVQMGLSGNGGISVAISGDYVVTGSNDNAKIWDIKSGKELKTLSGHSGTVMSVAILGDYVVTGSMDKTAKIWDIKSGKELKTLSGHTAWVNSVAISDENVVTGSYDNTAKIWDIKSGKELKTLSGHGGTDSISVAILGDYVVTGGYDNTAKIWDIKSGKKLKTLSGHSGMVMSVAILGDYVVTGSKDKTAKIWDIKSGKELKTLSGHTDWVNSVAISDENVVTGGYDNTAKIWDIKSGKELKTLSGHDYVVISGEHGYDATSVAISGEHIVIRSLTRTAKIWDIKSGKELKTLSGHSGTVMSVAILGDYVVTGGYDNTAKIWDIKSGKKLKTLSGYTDWVNSVAISDENVVTGGYDNTAKIWDIKSGKELKTLSGYIGGMGISVAISGDYIVTGSKDTAKIWDIKSGKELKTLSGHTAWVNSVAISDENVVTGSYDNTAKIWDIKSGKELKTLSGHSGMVISVAILGDYVVTGGYDNTAKIWDIKSGKKLKTLSGHSGTVMSVAILGDYVVTGSMDKTAKIWDIKSGKELKTLSGHTAWVNSVAISDENVVTGSDDNTAKIWDIKSGKEIAQFVSFDDGEWAVMTPEGYFDSSLNGYKNLNILTAPMSVSDIGIFYDVFYRPDIVKAKLEGKDITKLVGDMTFQKALQNPPPKISIGVSDKSTNKKEITIPYTVTSSGGGISEVRIFQNGKLVHGDGYYKNTLGYILTDAKEIGTEHKGIKGKPANVMSPVSKIAEEKSSPHTNSITIPLIAGEKNEISVMAFNKTNTVQSNPATVTITSTLPKEKGKLWVLGVGLDEYHEMDMLNYAVKDVKDFVCLYAGYGKECTANGNAKSIFGDNIEVEAYLTDNNATKANILKALTSIAQKAQPQDSFVWFQSGHGMLDADGNYHIVTFDTNLTKYKDKDKEKEMLSNTLNSNDILEVSKNIKAMSQLIVLDTCHAGGLDGKMGGLYDGRMSKLMKNMGVHLYAAAEPQEKARETKENQHGTFTSFLLEGLKSSMPDKNRDNQISIIELGQYAVDKTIEHEAKKQNENERQTPIMRNFGEDRAMYK